MFTCAICGEEFVDEKSLISHAKKAHGIKNKAEYYEGSAPRFNKLTGEKVKFKDTDSYFSHDFDSKKQIEMWAGKADKGEVKAWLVKSLKDRAARKGDSFAPCSVEIDTVKLADIKIYEKFFGSYDAACELAGLKPRLKTVKERFSRPVKFDIEILVDTREQQPLKLRNPKESKLSVGDYTLSGDNYNYTYIDRKSEGDFRGTVTTGFDRFCREVERAIALGAYLIVLVESSIAKIRESHQFQPWKQSTPEHAFRGMREIMEKYPKNVQFVFSGNRKNSEYLTPVLLQMGEDIWAYDMNYIIEKSGVLK